MACLCKPTAPTSTHLLLKDCANCLDQVPSNRHSALLLDNGVHGHAWAKCPLDRLGASARPCTVHVWCQVITQLSAPDACSGHDLDMCAGNGRRQDLVVRDRRKALVSYCRRRCLVRRCLPAASTASYRGRDDYCPIPTTTPTAGTEPGNFHRRTNSAASSSSSRS
jgi:hypothetical protein